MEKSINKLLFFTFIGAVFFGGLAFLFRNAKHDSIQQGDVNFELCEYIDIDLQKMPVKMIPYDGDDIRIVYKNDLPLDMTVGDNRLSITESKELVFSFFAGRESEFGITLYLPELSYREISVYTGTGDINVGRIDSGKMILGTETGDIVCNQAVSLLSVSTTSGFIAANIDYVVNGTEILSRRGDVLISLPTGASAAVDFETESGQCITELWNGKPHGSYSYSFNGGSDRIHAVVEKGTLTIK